MVLLRLVVLQFLIIVATTARAKKSVSHHVTTGHFFFFTLGIDRMACVVESNHGSWPPWETYGSPDPIEDTLVQSPRTARHYFEVHGIRTWFLEAVVCLWN
jgi:hypothetical protein